ncbi:hypothetical protein [Providencia sp.]|uniref:hypothetical protein n=1 Tax=Providencia sp. TaxID=589 RepID=UPI0035B3788B
MAKYCKKPVVIDAIQWTGDNAREIYDFCGAGNRGCHVCGNEMLIETLEGTMTASAGDYIICGVAGEYYPCKPDIFHATYEQV